eukprot:COSAG01_NODE_3998_length_5447_cov_2.455871_3_plen_140_part_00
MILYKRVWSQAPCPDIDLIYLIYLSIYIRHILHITHFYGRSRAPSAIVLVGSRRLTDTASSPTTTSSDKAADFHVIIDIRDKNAPHIGKIPIVGCVNIRIEEETAAHLPPSAMPACPRGATSKPSHGCGRPAARSGVAW